jgi:hypothetical protein
MRQEPSAARSRVSVATLWGQLLTLDTPCFGIVARVMARPIRVEFEGAVYHVTARGNERKPIYRDDRDRERFLAS